jgi:hypothetical protein
MSHLIYVNGLGPNYKGDNLYEFIFSDSLEVWGDSWDSRPSNGYPSPPELQYIKRVGVLRDTDVKLELIQNSDFFSMIDSMDDVVALAWEQEEVEDTGKQKRLVFRFGSSEDEIKDKLYERDLILEFEKKLVYES